MLKNLRFLVVLTPKEQEKLKIRIFNEIRKHSGDNREKRD